MRKLIMLVLVAVIAAGIGSCGVITGAEPTPSTTATATTTGHGLFYYQSQRGELGAALEQNEKETFAGCWVDGAKFVAVFTRDGRDIVYKYVEKDSPLDKIIELQTFPVTLEELKTAQRETMELLQNLDLSCSTSIAIKENIAEVYVTDKKLFDTTLAEAGATLPEHVRIIVTYEPLGEPPFEVNQPEGIHFPQLRMRSNSFMLALLTGTLELKDGYLYVGDALIIWQTDYFLTERDGAIEVLDRDGQVVGRVGEEISMGGGGIDGSYVNRYLKEPLPATMFKQCFLQGMGTRLSVNFNSDLFHIQVLEQDDGKMYFLTQKPVLLEAVRLYDWYAVDTCEFTATQNGSLLTIPRYGIINGFLGPENYAVLWPESYRTRIVNGVVEIADGSGKTVVRDGEKVFLEGNMLNPTNSELAVQLYGELPGGMGTKFYVVREVIPWQPDPETTTTSFEIDSITVNITASADLVFSGLKLEPGICEREYLTLSGEHYQPGDTCLVLSGTVLNLSPNRQFIGMSATGTTSNGSIVARTLDAAHIVGAIQLQAARGESRTFIIHLDPFNELDHLEIRAGSAPYPLP